MGILEMPIRICYNASRQNDESVQDGTTKNPGGCDSGVFLFLILAMERLISIGWLPTIYLHPAICKYNRRLYLPQ